MRELIDKFQISEPIDSASAVPYLTLLTLLEISDKLDKVIGESEMTPLSLAIDEVTEAVVEDIQEAVEEEKKSFTAMTRSELEAECDLRNIKFTKNMKDSTLIKRLEA